MTQMQSRFHEMSEAIVARIDEMGDRIDGLEKSISDLMNQAGEEETSGSREALPDSSANEETAPEAN